MGADRYFSHSLELILAASQRTATYEVDKAPKDNPLFGHNGYFEFAVDKFNVQKLFV